MFKLLRTIDSLVANFALYALLTIIFSILSLTILNILLRPVEISFLWIDPLVRHLVFLSAFLGGVLAIGKKQLIAIDIVSRYLEKSSQHRLKKALERIIYTTCIGALLWLIYGSFEFIQYAFEYEGADFFGIQRGFLVAIIPFGFSLMVYRFFYLLMHSLLGEAAAEKLPIHLSGDVI
ncbi:MAG: TRAP transporter small permease [Oligoflexia bacterium]|nr:TRAP transporter small permease [Oligoflexia bacterium]MBF0366788.1 TRAP transporter small permease [Oligoflexia bacterium]